MLNFAFSKFNLFWNSEHLLPWWSFKEINRNIGVIQQINFSVVCANHQLKWITILLHINLFRHVMKNHIGREIYELLRNYNLWLQPKVKYSQNYQYNSEKTSKSCCNSRFPSIKIYLHWPSKEINGIEIVINVITKRLSFLLLHFNISVIIFFIFNYSYYSILSSLLFYKDLF